MQNSRENAISPLQAEYINLNTLKFFDQNLFGKVEDQNLGLIISSSNWLEKVFFEEGDYSLEIEVDYKFDRRLNDSQKIIQYIEKISSGIFAEK